jgi:hypothetical protein
MPRLLQPLSRRLLSRERLQELSSWPGCLATSPRRDRASAADRESDSPSSWGCSHCGSARVPAFCSVAPGAVDRRRVDGRNRRSRRASGRDGNGQGKLAESSRYRSRVVRCRRRMRAARPARPTPHNAIVAGSGTARSVSMAAVVGLNDSRACSTAAAFTFAPCPKHAIVITTATANDRTCKVVMPPLGATAVPAQQRSPSRAAARRGAGLRGHCPGATSEKWKTSVGGSATTAGGIIPVTLFAGSV